MADQVGGWYPDPSGDPTKLRYWDGWQWTEHFAANPAYGTQTRASNSDQTLKLVAFVFCILSLVSVCWLIIPLAWMIPMSVHCWGIYKGEKPNTVGFGICTLIFLSIVGGIFLLVAEKDA